MEHEHAHGRVRNRRDARVRSDDDARALPVSEVRLYHAEGCHLCDRARAVVAELRVELGFSYEEVDIGGDPALEARYRELLPVVEIGGEQVFTYYVHAEAFRRKLAQSREENASL